MIKKLIGLETADGRCCLDFRLAARRRWTPLHDRRTAAVASAMMLGTLCSAAQAQPTGSSAVARADSATVGVFDPTAAHGAPAFADPLTGVSDHRLDLPTLSQLTSIDAGHAPTSSESFAAQTHAGDSIGPAASRSGPRGDGLGAELPSLQTLVSDPIDPSRSTQLGVGGRDQGQDEFDASFGRQQVYTDLRGLIDRLNDMQRPVVNVDVARSTQSDNLAIREVELSQDVFFAVGRTRFRYGYQNIDYSEKYGDSVEQNSLGGNGTHRINDWAAITGDFWANAIKPDNRPTAIIPTYDLYLTLWPSDSIRIDVDANRRIFDNTTSLERGIVADSFGGSVDYTPSDDLRATIRANYGHYSDNNDRFFIESEAVLRVRSLPQVQIGVRTSAFKFSRRFDDGYFNPDSYESGEGMIRVQAPVTNKLTAEFAGAAGVEHANPGGFKPLVRASFQLSYAVTKDWTLDGGVAYFSSRDTNSSGFARTTLDVGLHRKF